MQSVSVGDEIDQERSGWNVHDFVIAAALAVPTFAVHPVNRILSVPYWEDEAWVADLTRASWSTIARVGSPSPVGFVALLKLVPGSGMQRARLVPLAFCALTVVMAYVLARSIPWGSRVAARWTAVAVAGVVMLAPVSLQRNDLKQYASDAFFALVILAVGAAVDRAPERVAIWKLGVVAVVILPFSSTSAFVTVAVFAGLLGSSLLARDKRRVRQTLIGGAATAGLLAIYYFAVVVPKLSIAVTLYWTRFYLFGSPWSTFTEVVSRIFHLGTQLGMPGLMFIALFVIGIVVLVRRGARALAIAVPLLWVEMVVIGRLHKYPFLDLRTSNFLLVPALVVAAIGAVGAVEWIARSYRRVGIGVAVVLVAVFAAQSVPHVYDLSIQPEDVRTPTLITAAFRQPNDVILVSEPANFGFAYYWPGSTPILQTDSSGAGFRARASGVDAIYVKDRSYASILSGLRTAVRQWRGAGPGARLFIIRTHITAAEQIAWRRAMLSERLRPRPLNFFSREPSYVLGPPLLLPKQTAPDDNVK